MYRNYNARWLLAVVIAFVGGLAVYFIVPLFGIEPSVEIFTAGFLYLFCASFYSERFASNDLPPMREEG
ncbi:hypothetical protein [Alkalicoccobacillus porphyridii]|uniref:Uncharacterized protein n=1 Tax=Alkalicoccobacillus porphyridii TaxID=2597270 RepID=A0A553ZTI3_9BACI|nr:hypothetical protein [Alkalicoccobacillus porphyridii]TSB44788.1 hypothetical protein FN960_19485 [Alkalicoccobacillus porphyridii]